MALIVSVNIGVPRSNPWKDSGVTGIDKRPIDGPVTVTAPGPKGTGAVGLAGDRVYDIRNHGGDDQAVYAYAREDLDRWAAELGRELPDGVFGENLTTSGADVNAALIGERWRVGDRLVLEVSCPRIPCGTFQGWMREQGWIKRLLTSRSGCPQAVHIGRTPTRPSTGCAHASRARGPRPGRYGGHRLEGSHSGRVQAP
ncbi:MOSC domain-containing protein [Actinoallomurus sp. CA-150999]|uniref:MOSC domain-containing protein n=1 Tax=Actinoallomurus sp. CA-150999 TaxID=3239887 RepID=UPI003D939B38